MSARLFLLTITVPSLISQNANNKRRSFSYRMMIYDSKVPLYLCRFPKVCEDTTNKRKSICSAEVSIINGDSGSAEGLERLWGVCILLGVIGDGEEDSQV